MRMFDEISSSHFQVFQLSIFGGDVEHQNCQRTRCICHKGNADEIFLWWFGTFLFCQKLCWEFHHPDWLIFIISVSTWSIDDMTIWNGNINDIISHYIVSYHWYIYHIILSYHIISLIYLSYINDIILSFSFLQQTLMIRTIPLGHHWFWLKSKRHDAQALQAASGWPQQAHALPSKEIRILSEPLGVQDTNRSLFSVNREIIMAFVTTLGSYRPAN